MKERIKSQDSMLVRWARNVNEKNYDIDFMIGKLKTIRKEKLRILDVGGSVGGAAKAISGNVENAYIDVIDISLLAKQNFINAERTRFIAGDFLKHQFRSKYDAIIMRVLLHHLIDCNEEKTCKAQSMGLKKAMQILDSDGVIFITENFYQPFFFEDLTGRMIYEITKLKFVEKVVRVMGANTAGEGVRFRSWNAWENLFNANGLIITDIKKSDTWGKSIPLWQKIFLFCREAFQAVIVLQPASKG